VSGMSDEMEQNLAELIRVMYEAGRSMDEKMRTLARFCEVFSANAIDGETKATREALKVWADAATKVDKALGQYQYTRWCEMNKGANKMIRDFEGYLDWSESEDDEKLLALSLVVRDFAQSMMSGETEAMRHAREAFATAAALCAEAFSGFKAKRGDSTQHERGES